MLSLQIYVAGGGDPFTVCKETLLFCGGFALDVSAMKAYNQNGELVERPPRCLIGQPIVGLRETILVKVDVSLFLFFSC